MGLQIRKATREQAKLRLALIGPAGSGKTYSALKIAIAIAGDKPVLVLDTEHGSAEKYAGYCDPEIGPLEFDIVTPDSFSPAIYIEGIKLAEANGYGVIVLDSLSHAWMGKDGALELVDRAQARQKTPNSYTAWRDVTPLHNQMVDAIVGARVHVIATLRSKTEYVQEKDPQTGRTIIRKVGLQPVQRDGLEYEFDVVGDLDQDNTLTISKTRCPVLAGAVVRKPGRQIADALRDWLNTGAPPATAPASAPAPAPAPAPASPPATTAEDAKIRQRLAERATALHADTSEQAEKLVRAARAAYKANDIAAMTAACKAIEGYMSQTRPAA